MSGLSLGSSDADLERRLTAAVLSALPTRFYIQGEQNMRTFVEHRVVRPVMAELGRAAASPTDGDNHAAD